MAKNKANKHFEESLKKLAMKFNGGKITKQMSISDKKKLKKPPEEVQSYLIVYRGGHIDLIPCI